MTDAPGTNTLAITGKIDGMLDELEPMLPKGLQANRQIFRQADFIDISVNNVVIAPRDAAIIVAVRTILMRMTPPELTVRAESSKVPCQT